MRQVTHNFKMKKGTARNVLELIQDGQPTDYLELSLATGKTRDQLARVIKYLRSEGHVISTTTRGGHYSATLVYKGYF
ncbi:hypothetical protein VPHK404_0031 [Vibrio phage K404]|nr:hypothetical protein SIPHO059v1_p0082 [Vibrio phage 264E42.1]